MISDHSPIILRIPNGVQKRESSFRFSNFITDKEEFLPTVKSVWYMRFEGHTMYRVVQKMKSLKRKLKQLSWRNGNVFERAEELRKNVKKSQNDVDMFSHDERSYGDSGKGKAVALDIPKNVEDYAGANAVMMLLAKKEEEKGTLDAEEHDFMADRLEVFDSDCEDELNPTSLFMVDRVDAFDSDSDEEATSGTIFMVKLSPIELVSEHDGGPSYGTDSLSEVPTYDNYDMLNPFGHVEL
ncbi:hypothetical protein Tco_0520187 [Tanacetum coccineum]